MTKSELIDQRVVFLIRKATLRKLQTLARKNGRSLSGEVRFAIEQHTAKVRVRSNG